MLVDLIKEAVETAYEERATGAVLSGGIDSSTIVALAPAMPTFTGWYDAPGFDEREYARLAAGPDHHEIQITAQDFIRHFDEMLRAVDPPFQGMGTFGQYMVARYISENTNVRVVLSGEGGDELFGGYARLLIVAGEPRPEGYEDYQLPADYPDNLRDALAYDYHRLPLLLRVDDQCTSAWGLEARAPFTSPTVTQWVLGLPDEQRVGKRLLRENLRGIVPDRILDRRDKMGMPIPLVQWAQGPLRDFIGDRIGYIPDPDKPWDRGWWHDLCYQGLRVAA